LASCIIAHKTMTIISEIFRGITLLSLAIWLVLIASWGFFWQVWRYDADRDSVPTPTVWPSIVAVIPARNEAVTIRETISSLARQNYPGHFRMIVVDDDSEDRTAEAARQAADDAGILSRVEIISAPALPSGWTGKVWAMNTGVLAASKWAPEWFWFVDADIVLATDTLVRLVSCVVSRDLSLASLMVLLDVKSFPERLLMPPFLYFFLMLYPPAWISDSKSRTAGAAGGCLLLSADALEHIGGYASIHSQVIDDCALGQAVKRSGGRIWMGLTRTNTSIRSHATFSEIREMIARTAFTQLRYSPMELLGTLAGLTLTFILPVIMTFSRDPRIWPCALAAWILLCASIMPTLTFYRVSTFFALLLPAAALFYAYATGLSAVRYWLGHGAEWKRRSQAPVR
jgi:hopene-associated glycosyltransferase HpnB